MKTKTLILTVILAVSTLNLAVGNDAPGMAVVSLKGSAVFKVIYKGATAEIVRLHIYDKAGQRILSKTIPAMDGFIYPLNFQGLAAGDYTIELITSAGKQREQVTYQPVDVIKSIHISRIVNTPGKFLLSVGNSPNNSITVKIFDLNNVLVYSENKSLSGNFAQVYNITDPGSSYTFEVSDLAGNRKSFSF